jgi:hypothetical protein
MQESATTFYDTLGCDPGASDAEIACAWRQAVRVAHPDHGGDAQVFNRVTYAYEVLGNPEARARYDSVLSRERENARRDDEARARATREANTNSERSYTKSSEGSSAGGYGSYSGASAHEPADTAATTSPTLKHEGSFVGAYVKRYGLAGLGGVGLLWISVMLRSWGVGEGLGHIVGANLSGHMETFGLYSGAGVLDWVVALAFAPALSWFVRGLGFRLKLMLLGGVELGLCSIGGLMSFEGVVWRDVVLLVVGLLMVRGVLGRKSSGSKNGVKNGAKAKVTTRPGTPTWVRVVKWARARV